MALDPISSISHQLRTPLTVIISTVNNLLDGAFGPLNEEQTKWLKKLETHTNNLESLANDVLGFLKGNSQQTQKLAEVMNGTTKSLGVAGAKLSSDLTPPSAEKSHRAPKILIVDDEPDILDVIKEALEMQGWESVTASTGEEAVARTAELKPDVVLMDVLLQRQNGLEICRRLKKSAATFLPVILMTGQQDLREKISGAPQEADEILIKPFQMVELTARVSSMLRIKKLQDRLGNDNGAL
jgi:PleD family two-component response regulator